MDIDKLAQSLQSKPPTPFYLAVGPETFLRGEAVRFVREAVNRKTEADFIEIDADKLDARSLLDDLRTPALFAPKRLILIQQADKFIAASGEMLAEYAKRPSSGTVLIMTAESLDGRKKGPQALLKSATVVECPAMRDREIPAWCMTRARAAGKEMDMTTARFLVELAGTNLGQLDGQINNLAAYCNKRKKIRYEDVEELVGGDHARKIWDMADAVMKQDPAKALKAFDRLMREPGSAEFTLVPALASKLRDMIDVKRLAAAGHSQQSVQSTLRKHPYVIKLLMEAVRNTSLKELVRRYGLLLEADVKLKTAPNRERQWVAESLILRLCGLDSPAPRRRRA